MISQGTHLEVIDIEYVKHGCIVSGAYTNNYLQGFENINRGVGASHSGQWAVNSGQ